MTTTTTAANTFYSFSDLPLVLNANQLAGVLNISRANAYRLMRSESFPTLRVGNRMLVVPIDGCYVGWAAYLCSQGGPWRCILVQQRGRTDGVLVVPVDGCYVGRAAYYRG